MLCPTEVGHSNDERLKEAFNACAVSFLASVVML